MEQTLGTEIIDKLFYAISDSQQTQNGAKYGNLKINDELIEEVKQAIARSRNDEEFNLALAPLFTNQPAPEAPEENEPDSEKERGEDDRQPARSPSGSSANPAARGNEARGK